MAPPLLLIASKTSFNPVALLFGILDGMLIGLLPLILGIWGQAQIAYWGFAGCILASLAGGFRWSAAVSVGTCVIMLAVRFLSPATTQDPSNTP
jgi:hypothetical protein